MSAARRRRVRRRARSRCEYCRFHEHHLPFWPFHLEHVVAEQHGGETEDENLAWSCQWCNLRKGTNLAGIDPESGRVVPLFHPRRDAWPEHFVLGPDGWIRGRTSSGRATASLLQMNSSDRVAIRRILLAAGDW